MPWTPDIVALERRFRHRLLVVYLFIVAVLIVTVSTFQYLSVQREESRQAFQQKVTDVCYITRENTVNLNSAIDQLIESVQTSKTLTVAEKVERVKFYRGVKGKVPECPPK